MLVLKEARRLQRPLLTRWFAGPSVSVTGNGKMVAEAAAMRAVIDQPGESCCIGSPAYASEYLANDDCISWLIRQRV